MLDKKGNNESEREYWKGRSKEYNKLSIPVENANEIYDYFMSSELPLKDSDILLDVGTGNGVVATIVAPHVKQVIGIDKSREMLNEGEWKGNLVSTCYDITKGIPYEANMFNKVIVSYVLHHLGSPSIVRQVLNATYKSVKPGGTIIISSPIVPSQKIIKELENMFILKDDRLIFTEESLLSLLSSSKFKVIRHKRNQIRIEVVEWLSNSGLTEKVKQRMLELHLSASNAFKKAYNMTIDSDKCFIDTHVLLVEAMK